MPLSSDPVGKLEVNTNMSKNSTTSATPSPTSGNPPGAGDESGMPIYCPSAAFYCFAALLTPPMESSYTLLPTSMPP